MTVEGKREDHQVYEEALKDYTKGVNFITIDMEEAQTFESFTARLQL
jgi:hypothetical protein